jgi:hypothetical protein
MDSTGCQSNQILGIMKFCFIPGFLQTVDELST